MGWTKGFWNKIEHTEIESQRVEQIRNEKRIERMMIVIVMIIIIIIIIIIITMKDSYSASILMFKGASQFQRKQNQKLIT